MLKTKRKLVLAGFLMAFFLVGCSPDEPVVVQENSAETVNSLSDEAEKPEPTVTENISGRGTKEPIPDDVKKAMAGVSMPEGATVGYEDLSYLTIPHYDYKGNVTEGHLIVAIELADEVLGIFERLYKIEFPIERMQPVDRFIEYIDETFDTLDRASMSQNNTSAFYYRTISGSNKMSQHAYGRAIDINPRTNPYVIPANGYVSPANAYAYADRGQDIPGMIHHGDEVYQIFAEYGWEWGGDWSGEKDYQHFQKKK